MLFRSGQNSISEFIDGKNRTYNLSDVYDYDIYNFHSYLSEINADSTSWTAMRVTLERIEGLFEGEKVESASKIAKAIGMLNLFGTAGIKMLKEDLCVYAKYALDINNPEEIIND